MAYCCTACAKTLNRETLTFISCDCVCDEDDYVVNFCKKECWCTSLYNFDRCQTYIRKETCLTCSMCDKKKLVVVQAEAII